jgi:feruloyl esterase
VISRRVLPAVVALLLAARGAPAGTSLGCEGLTDLALPDTTITAAAVDPADGSCRVTGVVAPAVRFAVWMPAVAAWNGKLLGVGNGGLGGYVNTLGLPVALARGYATAGTDGGHEGSPFDSSWALGRPDLLADFGHRATHVMTVAAKAIVAAHYGAPAARAYFMGCSSGGRQGLIEAERHPADYDGIIAGAPANPLTALVAMAAWISQVLHADPATALPSDAIALIAAAVVERCDADDGVVDGLIRDPRRCRFRPRSLRCRGGAGEGECLTTAQVKALRRLYAGPRRARPRWAHPRLVPGGEVSAGSDAGPLGEPPTGGWGLWMGDEQPGFLHLIQESFFRFVVFEDPDWDWRTAGAIRRCRRSAASATGGACCGSSASAAPTKCCASSWRRVCSTAPADRARMSSIPSARSSGGWRTTSRRTS